MNATQQGFVFVFSWIALLWSIGFAFGFGALRGPQLAKYTGNTILIGLLALFVVPLVLGALGITELWGFWR